LLLLFSEALADKAQIAKLLIKPLEIKTSSSDAKRKRKNNEISSNA
jgi:hypothetical protein